MDVVLDEMLFELHERMLELRRQLGNRMVGADVTVFYAMDAMFHVLQEELRAYGYVPTTTDRDHSTWTEAPRRYRTHDEEPDPRG